MTEKYAINIKLKPSVLGLCLEHRFRKIHRFMDHIYHYDTQEQAEGVAGRVFDQFEDMISWIEIKKIHTKE